MTPSTDGAASATATARAGRLAEIMDELQLDALLVTDLFDVRYLTGYTGSNGLALVGREPQRRHFVTDGRYVTQAQEQVHGYARAIGETDLLEAVPGLLGDGPVRLGFDDANLTVKAGARLRELLPERVELIPAGGLVGRLRLVKDAEEVARIRAAAELADAALTRILEHGLAGRTERDVAIALEFELRRLGAQGPSFPTIVAHGAHGALPHASPRDAEIARGSLVVIDWGAQLDGYCSDCTRTYAAGADPGERAREVYDVVLRAQRAGLDAVAVGKGGREIDAVARELIRDAGYGEMGHGLGHGVGLEIHEAPRLSKASDSTLGGGEIVTVEPGIYLPGELGVRIEDLVHVTPGGPELLNGLPKQLTVV